LNPGYRGPHLVNIRFPGALAHCAACPCGWTTLRCDYENEPHETRTGMPPP